MTGAGTSTTDAGQVRRSRLARARAFARQLITEGLTPSGAAAAVFIGVFIGIVPIYGVQSIVAIALAALLRLNKPLTFAATFVNNPLLQPFIVFASIEVGHVALHGHGVSVSTAALSSAGSWRETVGLLLANVPLTSWLVGSILLAVGAGTACAALAWAVVTWHTRRTRTAKVAPFRRYVARRFGEVPNHARHFVQWKVRLDRIFPVLLDSNLGAGPVVDLGCGYGEVLALVAFTDERRTLYGCDLDPARIAAARVALGNLDVHLDVADVRNFPLPASGLILLIDVLQYLPPDEQAALLGRCAAALLPGGRVILRAHDVGRGVRARITTAFDSLVFRSAGFTRRPTHLTVEQYRQILTAAGLVVTDHPMTNTLPLVHVVLSASKPEAA